MNVSEMPIALAPSRVVGKRVRDARQGRGWTQADLTEALRDAGQEINQTEVSRLEREVPSGGKSPRVVTVETLYALAIALDVPPLVLLLPDDGETVIVGGDAEHRGRLRGWLLGRTPVRAVRHPIAWHNAARDSWDRTSGMPGLGDVLRDLAAQIDVEDGDGQAAAIEVAIEWLTGSLRAVEHRTRLQQRGPRGRTKGGPDGTH